MEERLQEFGKREEKCKEVEKKAETVNLINTKLPWKALKYSDFYFVLFIHLNSVFRLFFSSRK